jgi:photosystem II stability/assembly factor-like uncharacterized protein
VKGPGRDLATWCAFGVVGFVALALTTQASAGLNQWTILGPTGDEVYSIAVAPSLLSTVYVGTAQNAAIKTTDGGVTWAALGIFSEVDSLAVDPTNPNTVLVANQNDGIYRSTDGGANWQYGTYDYQELIAVGYAPSDHLRAYAGGWNGVVIRSTDGGASWGMAGTVPGQVLSIAVSPASPDTVYVATQGPPYRSTDGGATWAVLSLPIANYLVFSSDGSLLAGTAGWYDCPGGGVSRSTDDGSTWTSLGLSLPAGAGAVAAIVASSADPATIYAGTMGSGVFKTTDGGGTWAPTALVSTSINALATGATANDVYAGAVGAGLLQSTDGGASWQTINTLLGSSATASCRTRKFRSTAAPASTCLSAIARTSRSTRLLTPWGRSLSRSSTRRAFRRRFRTESPTYATPRPRRLSDRRRHTAEGVRRTSPST